MTHGLSGSGKSTLSQALVDSLGAIRLRSDVERKRLHGLAADARTHAVPGGGIYTPQADRLTYARLAELAGKVLDAGYPVIVDATFVRSVWRELFRESAWERQVPFLLVACAALEATLRERVDKRSREAADASEAGIDVLERQIASLEPLAAHELDDAVLVETSGGVLPSDAVNAIARRLGIEPA